MNRDERAAWASRISAARRLRKMSQRELSERSGVSEKTINDMDNEKTVPNVESLTKLATVLEVAATPSVIEAVRDSWPENVRNYADIVGQYLMIMPEEIRDDAGDEVIHLLLGMRNGKPNGRTNGQAS
jgi:transcriptional regulator with XRE-family HTH domain